MSFEVLLATTNNHKRNEFQEMLSKYGIKVYSFSDFNIDPGEVEENGKDFVENSLIKVRHASKLTKLPVIADDSGVCIDSLNGFPGVKTARYAFDLGGQLYANREIVNNLLKDKDRKASFKCVISISNIKEGEQYFEGEVKGEIVKEYHDELSFGYDPIFYSYEKKNTFYNLSSKDKNEVSHRGRAVNKLIMFLKEHGYIN